jgi:hypothetical protein
MWLLDDFGVLVFTEADGKRRRLTRQSAAAVLTLLESPGPMAIQVSAGIPGVSLADFHLWRTGEGIACLRIDEHREHYGIDPERSGQTGDAFFPDGQGGSFPVQFAETVQMSHATEAIAYWLECGGKWQGLTWS